MAAQLGVAGAAKVGANCMIGGQVGIAGHIEVGDRVAVGAQTGIPKSVPADSRIMGSPAVPWGDFARLAAAWRRLPEALRTLDRLEKTINPK